ncbi:aftiphilin a isoform X1 [Takifugu rubripes]|uniref:aftiphilin a isoform X1 n=1 Tax=Takifugu rubripes TaxID=31033 RepID=UPI0005D248FB|nr:aftiphilin-like isoform X1 [Takifugu rubripes]|eukprot:XP_011610952.1 PREDICTED: aftiphilin-like isoform X3 [Takifugu rubripes]
MEPGVIHMYSSSPPPMDDGTEEEDSEFGDFGTFPALPASISLTELDTPTTFNQTQALNATSPPELLNSRGMLGFSHSSSTSMHRNEPLKANGVVPAGHRGDTPTDRTETKSVLTGSPVHPVSDPNSRGPEALTNGFLTFDLQGSPSLQNSVHSLSKGTSVEDLGSVRPESPEDDFADFASFSDAEGHVIHPEQRAPAEDTLRDSSRTQESESISAPAEAPDGSCNTGWGPGPPSDAPFAQEHLASVCTNTLNGLGVADGTNVGAHSQNGLSPSGPEETEQIHGKSSDTETETETSLGRLLSTDALEEYADMSTTGSVPSPPLQGETTTPADHSQLAEDDEDFGDFGDASSFSAPGFTDFEQDAEQDGSRSHSSAPTQEPTEDRDDNDFGNFNAPKFQSTDNNTEKFTEFPISDSFGNFSSATDGQEADAGWSAFGEGHGEGESWAAFSTETHISASAKSREEEKEQEHRGEEAAVRGDDIGTDKTTASLSSRLEKLFQSSFPQPAVPSLDEEVVFLRTLLGPAEDRVQAGGGEEGGSLCNSVWMRLQDIHEAFGLRHQWGGSHCNKVLLSCLGIDTRNILFTGQKKQPVIVPMYAASLGMLEPTKEPVKPISAAEMIASIGQMPPVVTENSDSVQQEALPPIQFDWSSSGLTNPLDASGGSALLNLDFFGPVEDSGSTNSASMPGVDPELYELTTAKLDLSSSSSRMVDAFARLMSTMEKTSTSTRKPRKEENLSEEAAKVIAALPDLSFMQAKVLMFPATLTPLVCQSTPD